jgi:hypothetical protein
MSNRFREELTSGEVEQEAQPGIIQEKTELPRNFITTLLTQGVISKESATEMLPFIIFLAFLSMIYIGNKHLTERNIRDIDKLNKEVKELTWDFKTLKADLMQKSTQSEVARFADSLGLKEPVEPPKRLIITANN